MVLLCLVPCLTSAVAQESRGIIAGTVKDSSGAVLPGALVEILPTGKRAVTDAQGQFRIADIAPGDYTVVSSYVGFQSSSQKIDVSNNRITTVNASLGVALQADAIIVTGERLRGEAEAINIQRTSDDIVQVLPSKVINSLPNTNIADAVGRLPSVTLERDEGEGKYVQIRGTEPRLSNTTIDGVNVPSPEGNVRNVKLDVIPAALVDRIEVFKTLTPNQDADAIGGSVNLVTRSAGERPTYSFGAGGGYTPIQNGRWLSNYDGTYGKRFGATHRFGFLLGGTYDHNDRGIDDLEPSPAVGQTPDGKNVAFFSAEDLRTYKYYRTRYGLAGGMDYTPQPGANIYLKGLYSDFHDYGDTWVYTPNAGAITAQSGAVTTFDNTGIMQYRHYVRRPDQQIFSILTGVVKAWNSTSLNVEFAGGRAHNIGGQDFATTRFSNANNYQFTLDTTDPFRPKFDVPTGVNIYDTSQYNMSQVIVPKQHSTQLNFQGAASVAKLYTLASHVGSFEFGVKIRNAHKTQNEDDHYYGPSTADGAPPTPTMTPGLGNPSNPNYSNPNYYNGSYQFGPMTDYSKLQRLFQNNQSAFSYDPTASRLASDPATYGANERIYAGYGMDTITINKFRFVGGLRIEATDSNYSANLVTLNNGAYVSTTPVTGSSGYINFLPSVQVQYQVTANTNLRVSYGRGISRPNPQDIVPSTQIDPNTIPPSIVQGNPALLPTKANNYDILVEHYFRGLGLIQGGYFYKALTDPIYPTTTTISGGTFNGYQVKQSVNGPSAHIGGIELAYQQRLSFLPGMLNSIGVNGNYSYTYSQVTFPDAFNRTNAPLQRQAPNTWNVGMTYDKSRFAMRFGISHNDSNIYSYAYGGGKANESDPILGLKGPLGDQYLYAHTQYDIQGSYRLWKALSVVASGLNLSNEVFGFYQGSTIYPIQREYYHPSVLFGFRWSSSASE
jgi:TonB-dependent receptor